MSKRGQLLSVWFLYCSSTWFWVCTEDEWKTFLKTVIGEVSANGVEARLPVSTDKNI